VRLETGAGERPDPGYEIHTDVLPLAGTQLVCRLDWLPFADAAISALRANHVLEQQSWQLVEPTLRDGARAPRPGATVDIGVPDARYIGALWLGGAYRALESTTGSSAGTRTHRTSGHRRAGHSPLDLERPPHSVRRRPSGRAAHDNRLCRDPDQLLQGQESWLRLPTSVYAVTGELSASVPYTLGLAGWARRRRG
jgi:hypothetical protein